MQSLEVQLQTHSYPIIITNNFKDLNSDLVNLENSSKLIIITDKNVSDLYGEEFRQILSQSNHSIYTYVIEPSEASKSMDCIRDIYKYLLEIHCNRKDTIIALGGGVVGDIGGFVAATYMRGLSFIQVPTTLLAQVDSSIGGKNGINFMSIKNIIGTFKQPQLVYINTNVLKTLEHRQFLSGIAEILIHSLIKNSKLLEVILENTSLLLSQKDDSFLEYIILENCKIKASVVMDDEFDQGNRAMLNFGHTIGHAVESTSNYQLTHGESISIGVIGAFKIAYYMGLIKGELVEFIYEVMSKLQLPSHYKGGNIEQIYENIYHDKKVDHLNLNFILPLEIGKVSKFTVKPNILKKVLKELSS